MKKILAILAVGGLLLSCGEKKEKKKGGFEMNRTKKEVKAEATSIEIPIDMDNKGVGPISSIEFGAEIDAELAAKGEDTYNSLCVACHTAEKRLIGPPLKGVFDRRSPEWVMNMILNPDGMIKEDPIAMALYKEYNGAAMLNNNLNKDEARAIAAYLRTF